MITGPSRATTLMACFNCARRSAQVHLYRFDLDLPSIPACRVCVVALSLGDFETLAALHDACSATELAPGVPRRPAQCKTGPTPSRSATSRG